MNSWELIIKATDIYVEYTGRKILDIDNLEIYSYDRIGLVGGNGTGKSTLMSLLSGKTALPECKIQRFGEIAYIPQLENVAAETAVNFAMMSRLGVSDLQANTMSGGEETRTKIATVLSRQTHALFADEPTCHLDRIGIDLLIRQLKAFDGALLIISHDRYFLDETVDKIWERNKGKIVEYWSGYSKYLNQKKEKRERQATQHEMLMQERERLERSISEKRKLAQQLDKKPTGSHKKSLNESAGRLGHQKLTGSKQKKMHNAVRSMEKRVEALGDIQAP